MIATIPSEATPGIESGLLNTPLECRRHRSRHHRPFYSLACIDCTLSLANMLSRVTMSAVTAVLQTDSARGERRVRLGSLTNDAAPIAHR